MGHWRDEGLGIGQGLSLFSKPRMGHSDGKRSLGEAWTGVDEGSLARTVPSGELATGLPCFS